MNIEKILETATAIRKHTVALDKCVGFNMRHFYANDIDNTPYRCDTVGCIAGWVCMLDPIASHYHRNPTFSYAITALDILGLDVNQADELFYLSSLWGLKDSIKYDSIMRSITPEKAATVLENLALTGIVDWCIPESIIPLMELHKVYA